MTRTTCMTHCDAEDRFDVHKQKSGAIAVNLDQVFIFCTDTQLIQLHDAIEDYLNAQSVKVTIAGVEPQPEELEAAMAAKEGEDADIPF